MFSSLLKVINQSLTRRCLAAHKLQHQTISTFNVQFASEASPANTHAQSINDEHYKITLRNATDQAWHFGVFQKQPSSPGLSSVAWQVRGIPPKINEVVPTAEVSWTLEYGVCITNFDKNDRKYTGMQLSTASLGSKYKVVTIDGIPSISPVPTGTGSADQIVLQNNTGPPAIKLSMGFTLENKIVVVEDEVGGLQKTIFRVHPTYYVACYRNIVPGQLVDEGVVIGPVEIKYDAGFHAAIVEAFKDATGNYRMKAFTVPSTA